ncbi:MAG: glycosyltransferase [Planctomycetes bacterium]|nr:glycosyltransferase [Planctomycetota bacterium]
MKVLVLAPSLYDTSPGQRFRIELWARRLEGQGLDFTFAPFEDEALHQILYQRGRLIRKASLMAAAFGRRLALLPRARHFDVALLFREACLLGPPLIESLLVRQGLPLVFDFDDAIWVPYVSPANQYLSYLKCFWKTPRLCRISRHILAGNPYLAAYAHSFNPRVSIIPTTIDTDIYQVRSPAAPRDGVVTVGWTGSYSTVQHLDILRPALQALRRRAPFRLMVLGTSSYPLEGVEVSARPWQAQSEVTDLQQFDIGIMPLPDDEWSRGKCGLKLLQCMAVGVPVIGSPVGVNGDIIQDGVNGFLAASDDEWVDKLSLLIADPELRREMGRAGRRTVEERYSGQLWAPRVREVLEEVASGRSRLDHGFSSPQGMPAARPRAPA